MKRRRCELIYDIGSFLGRKISKLSKETLKIVCNLIWLFPRSDSASGQNQSYAASSWPEAICRRLPMTGRRYYWPEARWLRFVCLCLLIWHCIWTDGLLHSTTDKYYLIVKVGRWDYNIAVLKMSNLVHLYKQVINESS